MTARFYRWISSPRRLALARMIAVVVYLALAAGADLIHSWPWCYKSLLTLLALAPTVLMLAYAQSHFLGTREPPGGSEVPSEHGQGGSVLDDAAELTALSPFIAWTAASVVGATLGLAAIWIKGALGNLGLYQLLVSVVMLSTIAIGFVHLTYARKQLDEAEQQNRRIEQQTREIANLSQVLGTMSTILEGLDAKGVGSLMRSINRLHEATKWVKILLGLLILVILTGLGVLWVQGRRP